VYTPEALLDVHERAQRSLARLIAHCGELAPAEIDRTLEGFGYSTVRLQLHHVIQAERYWVGVLHGRMETGEDDADFPTVASLAALRESVASATRAYLTAASAAELSTPRPMRAWSPTGPKDVVLMPARVILRTQTHVYQHTGQVAAMCRLLGRPVSGMEFPIL
jgi:uncharacterized damage-inducible protein DinB